VAGRFKLYRVKLLVAPQWMIYIISMVYRGEVVGSSTVDDLQYIISMVYRGEVVGSSTADDLYNLYGLQG
jgi:hypothetical protein